MRADNPILVDLPMPILTPRLLIRPAMPGDGAATHEAIEETLDQLTPWLHWAKDCRSKESVEADIRRAYADYILRRDLRMHGFERGGGRLVVFSGLHRPNWKVGCFEIGYWVRHRAQGQGYAAEMTNALVRYAFAVLEARRIEIGHADGNAASQAVISKLGFEHECRRRMRDRLPDGSIVDDHRYVLLSPDALPALEVSWDDGAT